MPFSDKVKHALVFAYELHHDQTRKGKQTPYVSHLLAVASLVAEHNGDEEQFMAALLHDAAEDQGGALTLEKIRQEFGDRVASLVDGCTDTVENPKPPWRPRKEAYLAKLPAKSPEQKLVIAADKLHNAQCILRDLRSDGIGTLDRFNGGRDGTLWYHHAVAEALAQGWAHPIVDELREVVQKIDELAQNEGSLAGT